SPGLAPEALAKMAPDQREGVTAAMGRSNQPHVVRVCVTEKALQRGFNMKEPQQGDCSRTILTSTTRQIDVRLVCTGASKVSGTFRFEAVDRHTLPGNVDLVLNHDANTMTMKRTIQGKWLKADGGNVKPDDE